MEPISIIVTALALGAAAGLKPLAEQAVKDAYDGLKELVKRKYPSAAPTVDYLASRPDRQSVRQDLQEDLAKTAAAQDAELLTQAQALLQAVEAKAPEAAATIGVSLENIKGASLELSKILAQGSGQGSTTGVSLKDADIQGDIKISDVTATHISGNPQGPIFTGPVGHAGDRNINTGGGSYVEGGVNTGGAPFVGRDQQNIQGGQYNIGSIRDNQNVAFGPGAQAHYTAGPSAADLERLFQPLRQAIEQAPVQNQEAAAETVQKLQEEAAKGKQADDQRIARLVDRLVDLVPGAVSALVAAFGQPASTKAK